MYCLYMNKRNINFFEKMNKKFPKSEYIYSTIELDPNAYCNPQSKNSSEQELFAQQKFVSNFIYQDGIRSVLVFHGLGSGKTCASLVSAIKLLNTPDSGYNKVLVFLPGFLKVNFEKEMKKCSFRESFLDPSKTKIISYNSSNVKKKVFTEYDIPDLDKKTLYEKLKGTIIIVDEAHHLIQLMHNALVSVEGLKKEKANEIKEKSTGHFFYDLFMNLQDVKIIFLSGTPLTNYGFESAVMANVLNGYITLSSEQNQKLTIFPESSDIFYRNYIDEANSTLKKKMKSDFERRFIGIVSYFPSIEDKRIFPEIITDSKMILPMQGDQLRIYFDFEAIQQQQMKGRFQKERFSQSLRKDNPGTFLVYTRMVSNFVFPIEYFEKYIFYGKRHPNAEIRKIINKITTPNLTLSSFLQFKEMKKIILNRAGIKKLKTDYVALLKDFMDKFDIVSGYYFNKSLINYSVKYNEMSKTIEKNLLERSKKTVIYSYFKNWAGTVSIGYLLQYMGYTPQKDTVVQSLEEYVNEMEQNEQETNEQNEPENTLQLEQNLFESLNDGSLNIQGGFMNGNNNNEMSNLKPLDEKQFLKSLLPSGARKIQVLNKGQYLIFEGDNVNKKRVLDLFNSKENENGDLYPILIISSAGSEGISLKNVRFMHILDPFWNMNRTEQVIGRARRLCSHFTLEPEYQNVSVYQYFASAYDEPNVNKNKSTDLIISELAQSKQKILQNIYDIFMNVAVDCPMGNRQTCTRYKYNFTNHTPDMQKYFYDYYEKNRKKFKDISENLMEQYFEMYPLDNNYYVAKNKDSKQYYLVRFNKIYIIEGKLESNQESENIFLRDINSGEILKKFKKSDIEMGIYKPLD